MKIETKKDYNEPIVKSRWRTTWTIQQKGDDKKETGSPTAKLKNKHYEKMQ